MALTLLSKSWVLLVSSKALMPITANLIPTAASMLLAHQLVIGSVTIHVRRLYTMRDVCELCVKTSKIRKLCIVYRGWFASMFEISPRGGNFAHHQRKNLHSHFSFRNVPYICWLKKNELRVEYMLEFADCLQCAFLFANRASRIVHSHL